MRIFFRKIYLINQEHVPNSGPLIFASTHPNSFLDDILMATISNRPLHFLARGDVFKKRWSRIILKAFHVHPIYRATEFKNNLNKNEESFAFSRSILANNGIILIHPEGICVHEKRVRNLRKGIGRIAFGAEEENHWKLGLKIVPVSLNYTDAPKGGEDVMVVFGQAINVSEYQESYHANSAKALLDLNTEIKSRLIESTIVINHPQTDETINQCLRMGRNNSEIELHSTVSRSPENFDFEKKVAGKLNSLFEINPTVFADLESKVNQYTQLLRQNKLTDLNLARSCKNMGYYLLCLLTFEGIFLILGYFFNILPTKFAQRVTQKKVKLIEFKASVFFTLGLLIFGLIYASLLLVCFLILGWWGVAVFLALAFIAYRTPKNHQRWIHFRTCFRIQRLRKKHPQEFQQIITLRREICEIALL